MIRNNSLEEFETSYFGNFDATYFDRCCVQIYKPLFKNSFRFNCPQFQFPLLFLILVHPSMAIVGVSKSIKLKLFDTYCKNLLIYSFSQTSS